MDQEKKSLTYYHIMHGGVPMSAQGVKRFIYFALNGGYTEIEVIAYLDNLKRWDEMI